MDLGDLRLDENRWAIPQDSIPRASAGGVGIRACDGRVQPRSHQIFHASGGTNLRMSHQETEITGRKTDEAENSKATDSDQGKCSQADGSYNICPSYFSTPCYSTVLYIGLEVRT